MSWLPGTQIAVPRLDHRHDELAGRSACPGPRSTRSPTNTARRPVGRRAPTRRRASTLVAELAQQLVELVVAAVDVADDVERAVLGAAVGPQRRALDLGRLDLLGDAQHADAAEALALQALQRAAQLRALLADDVRAEVAVRPRAVALLADRLGQVEHDRDRRTGRARLASSTSGWRASRCTLVASTTVSARLREPLAGDEVQHLERVRRSRAWSFSSSATSPRQKSDEITSVGVKCLRANVLLPGARRRRSARRGWDRGASILIALNTAICVGGADARASSGPTGR